MVSVAFTSDTQAEKEANDSKNVAEVGLAVVMVAVWGFPTEKRGANVLVGASAVGTTVTVGEAPIRLITSGPIVICPVTARAKSSVNPVSEMCANGVGLAAQMT